jgi:polysaccharide biosynthesis protein PslA
MASVSPIVDANDFVASPQPQQVALPEIPRTRSKAARRVQLYALLAAGDIAAIVAGISGASAARLGFLFDTSVQDMLMALVPLYLLLGAYNQAFGLDSLERRNTGIRRALSTLGLTAMVVVGVGFALKISSDYSRIVLVAGLIGSAILVVGFRFLIAKLSHSVLGASPIEQVVLCDGAMFLPSHGERIVNARALGLQPRLDCPQMLDRIGHVLGRADRVIIACAPESRAAWTAATKGLVVNVEVLIPEVEQLGVLATHSYDGRLTAIVGRGPLALRDKILKRAFDLAAIVAVLPFLAIVTAVVAALIKLDDGGPIFFVQNRIGQGNRLFPMYKFRSMRVAQLDNDGKVSTARNDSRVTRIGKILRSTSVDELPQLFNVLKGDMSIVGPRPHALASTAGNELFWDVDERYWIRHATKPGLTGLAQVRGYRGATETAGDLINRVQSDLEYLSGWSLWRDLKIVAATLRVVLHPNAF